MKQFNNKDIIIGGEPFFIKEWFSKGVLEIRDLLKSDDSFLSFNGFRRKYGLTKTNFLQFYQVVKAILKRLILKSISMQSSALAHNIFLAKPKSGAPQFLFLINIHRSLLIV